MDSVRRTWCRGAGGPPFPRFPLGKGRAWSSGRRASGAGGPDGRDLDVDVDVVRLARAAERALPGPEGEGPEADQQRQDDDDADDGAHAASAAVDDDRFVTVVSHW